MPCIVCSIIQIIQSILQYRGSAFQPKGKTEYYDSQVGHYVENSFVNSCTKRTDCQTKLPWTFFMSYKRSTKFCPLGGALVCQAARKSTGPVLLCSSICRARPGRCPSLYDFLDKGSHVARQLFHNLLKLGWNYTSRNSMLQTV